MIYVGIDPGRKGSYCSITDNGIDAFPWDDVFFIQHMQSLLATGNGLMACVEKVSAFSGQGRGSIFTFGTEYGFIQGALQALGIPFQLVPSNVWKKSYSLIGKDKKASIDVCRKLFPELNLLPTPKSRVPSDGLAEAALLALYAKRHF
jgi:crossover junction endodeoxyribonuclease RuvC